MYLSEYVFYINKYYRLMIRIRMFLGLTRTHGMDTYFYFSYFCFSNIRYKTLYNKIFLICTRCRNIHLVFLKMIHDCKIYSVESEMLFLNSKPSGRFKFLEGGEEKIGLEFRFTPIFFSEINLCIM